MKGTDTGARALLCAVAKVNAITACMVVANTTPWSLGGRDVGGAEVVMVIDG